MGTRLEVHCIPSHPVVLAAEDPQAKIYDLYTVCPMSVNYSNSATLANLYSGNESIMPCFNLILTCSPLSYESVGYFQLSCDCATYPCSYTHTPPAFITFCTASKLC